MSNKIGRNDSDGGRWKAKFFCLLFPVFAMIASSVKSDSVTDDSGKEFQKLKIVSVTMDSAVCSDSRKIPLKSLRKILFDSFKVASKPSGIYLDDGTRLSGIIRKREKDSVVFRSTSLGEITIPCALIAAEYYVPKAGAFDPKTKVPLVMDVNGKMLNGKILWHDDKTIGVMTDKGLERLGNSDLSFVLIRHPDPKIKILLRNGDVINLPSTFDGEKISLNLNGGKLTLPLSSVMQINN